MAKPFLIQLREAASEVEELQQLIIRKMVRKQPVTDDMWELKRVESRFQELVREGQAD